MWNILLAVGGIIVGGYVIFAAFLLIFQSRFIYYPTREIESTPDDAGLTYESCRFEASDGVSLSGWFIPAEKSRGVILFCHGNGGNISHRLESIQQFHRLGLSTFIFDYRGYGESGGELSEKGTYLDAEAAWRYLVEEKQFTPDEIIIFGRSLGGAIAAWLAKEHQPKALMVESAFTSIGDVGSEMYPFLPIRLLTRFRYSTVDYIRQIHCPVLIVHSSDDELIPFSHGQRLFRAAPEPKRFLEISGGHEDGFLVSAKQYEDGFNRFISEYVAEPA